MYHSSSEAPLLDAAADEGHDQTQAGDASDNGANYHAYSVKNVSASTHVCEKNTHKAMGTPADLYMILGTFCDLKLLSAKQKIYLSLTVSYFR